MSVYDSLEEFDNWSTKRLLRYFKSLRRQERLWIRTYYMPEDEHDCDYDREQFNFSMHVESVKSILDKREHIEK